VSSEWDRWEEGDVKKERRVKWGGGGLDVGREERRMGMERLGGGNGVWSEKKG